METTPSLACANKCVFCWRHHTNPVGKSWQWKMDDPVEIVNTALDLHTKMIKQMKGVPGWSYGRCLFTGITLCKRELEGLSCDPLFRDEGGVGATVQIAVSLWACSYHYGHDRRNILLRVRDYLYK